MQGGLHAANTIWRRLEGKDAAAVQVPRPRQRGDDRAVPRHRQRAQGSPQRVPRLGGVVLRPPRLPHRLRRPPHDDDALAALDDRARPGRAGVQHRPHRRRPQPARVGARDRPAGAVSERADRRRDGTRERRGSSLDRARSIDSEETTMNSIQGAERGDAVAVPADRRLRLPVGLPHRRPRRARRWRRLAVRPTLRLAQRLRQPARPGGGHVPLRSVRHQRADAAGVRGRDERPRDDVEDAVGVGRRQGRADPSARREAPTSSRRTPDPLPTTTPSTSSCEPRSASTVKSRWSSSVSRSSTTARPSATWALVDETGHTADATGAGADAPAAHRHVASASRAARVRARRLLRVGDKIFCSLVVGRRTRRPGRRGRRHRAASTRRLRSGGTGSTRRGSRTTVGATRSSARRWRSRA